jgi:hypothetical protein
MCTPRDAFLLQRVRDGHQHLSNERRVHHLKYRDPERSAQYEVRRECVFEVQLRFLEIVRRNLTHGTKGAKPRVAQGARNQERLLQRWKPRETRELAEVKRPQNPAEDQPEDNEMHQMAAQGSDRKGPHDFSSVQLSRNHVRAQCEFEIEVREVGQRVTASHCTYRQNYVG